MASPLNLSAIFGPSSGGLYGLTALLPLAVSSTMTPVISLQPANSNQSGYLSAEDWNTFNNRQIGPLTGDVTTIGSAATVAFISSVPASYFSGISSNVQTQLNSLTLYSPGAPSDWASTPPTTIAGALDRMAALLRTLNAGNPIP